MKKNFINYFRIIDEVKMSWLDLVSKYKVNRILTKNEIQQQLNIKLPLDITPNHALGVIKMNSTYLETVNKYYIWKGKLTSIAIFMGYLTYIILMLLLFYKIIAAIGTIREANIKMTFIIVTSMSSVIPIISTWLVFCECFKWTHYPIRFNRHNRMVYVFRSNGTVLEASWDQLFFCLAKDKGTGDWEIHGYVLAEDGETVKETFPLAVTAGFQNYALSHWEFIRRYMENGPQECFFDKQKKYKPGDATTATLLFCNDIDGKKESVAFSNKRIKLNFVGASFQYYMYYPFIKMLVYGRIIAMKTCKVPQWPQSIENVCTIFPDDPYIVTAQDNINITLTYGEIPVQNGKL
ncbi:hypothetical protein IUY40_01520 [Flavobacterium sp. ALJ2]|uniref:DUF6708 domain-containing protein n=1 Tax=Flavobacterium sp. ALJ2 TaxID=2786960 RepID=UPI00189FCC4B|nr:DUF6708 domain-containing protein [Flavobacterium sp. ALJ2]MBF7090221.1 hypothetical protein [Flavobacterium sp. ALJ2]